MLRWADRDIQFTKSVQRSPKNSLSRTWAGILPNFLSVTFKYVPIYNQVSAH